MAFLLLLILARLSLSSFLAGPSSPRQVVVMPAEIENTQTVKGVSACRFHACDNVITSLFFLTKEVVDNACPFYVSVYTKDYAKCFSHISRRYYPHFVGDETEVCGRRTWSFEHRFRPQNYQCQPCVYVCETLVYLFCFYREPSPHSLVQPQ